MFVKTPIFRNKRFHYFFSYETSVRTVNHSEPVTTTSTSCSNSSESSPLTSSSRPKKQNNNSKSVKFNPEVIDNELTSEKLIYAKLPMASPPKKPTVIIDIAKLNADQGFGFNNKYLITSDNAGSQDYNKDIFDSPYFDYRRTHSTVSSTTYYFHQKILKDLVIKDNDCHFFSGGKFIQWFRTSICHPTSTK